MTKRRPIRPQADLPPWTPFVRGELESMTLLQRLDRNDALAKQFGTTVDAVQRQLTSIEQEEAIWINSRYQVNIRRIHNDREGAPDLVHLSIKRRDKGQVGEERYRDFMRIKDELLSPEHEAIEIYPARSREVDTSNQYHMWAIDSSEWRVPFGFSDGRKVMGPMPNSKTNVVQSPFEPHHRI